LPGPNASAPNVLHIRLFGTPEFTFGQPLANTLPKRSLSVLAYLLLHRDSQLTRDRIAFDLWPDVPEDDARAHLRRAFYTLQLWLPHPEIPWFTADRRHARWNRSAPYLLDVEEYEAALDAGRLAEAADLYVGDLLETFEDEWIVSERDRLRETQLDLLRRLVAQQRKAGDIAAAIESAERALKIDPWLEGFVRDAMELRSLAGDRASALREYRSFEEALKREMNASPEQETSELFERIRAGEQESQRPPHAQAFSNNLPAELTPLVGRQHDVELLSSALKNYRLITIVGTGGIGKSRLALRVGAIATEHYPDGVWLVDLASISSETFIPSAVASALNIHESRNKMLHESILRTLDGRRALLIFDNCEHLANAAAQFAEELLRHCPNLQIVMTSSQPLSVEGEFVYRVGTLAFPTDCTGMTAIAAMGHSAVELFVQRARAAHHLFELTDANAAAVSEICKRLDGIPLAIELAAARARVLSPAHLNEGLKTRFRLLTSGTRTGLPRHQTLRALMDWSYALLDERERALLRRVAIFAGSFSLEASTAVCMEAGSDDVDVLMTLASLVEKSLVVAEVGDVADRYRLLESTRIYLAQKLDESGEREPAAKSAAEFYRSFAERAEREFHKTPQAAWFSSVAQEHENIRVALVWALTEGHDPLLGGVIAGALHRYWYDCGRPQEGLYWIEGAFSAVDQESDPDVAGRLCLAHADLLEGNEKLRSAQAACALLEKTSDQGGLAYALRQWALALEIDDRLEAEELCRRAADLMKTSGDMGGLAIVLNTLASFIARGGDFETARSMHEQALTIARSYGAEYAVMHAQLCLADMEYEQGDYEKAVVRAEDALCHADASRTVELAANFCCTLAACRIGLGQYAQAAADVMRALVILRNAHNNFQIAVALQHLALIEALTGDATVAARLAGYVDAYLVHHSIRRQATELHSRQRLDQVLRAKLPDSEYETLLQEGAALSEEQAIAAASSGLPVAS
jgi:predicted ATPase/DNA-binding SARP family transcriptional activator